MCDKGGRGRSIKPLNGRELQQQDNEAQDDGDDDTQRKTKPKKGRKAGSRKAGCEFKLAFTRTPDNEWAVEVLIGTHNHEASLTHLPILPTKSSPRIKRSFSNLWPIELRGDYNSEQRWIHPN